MLTKGGIIEMALKPENPIRQKALKDKSEEEQLKILAFFALVDLSNFYEQKGSSQQYEINKLLHQMK